MTLENSAEPRESKLRVTLQRIGDWMRRVHLERKLAVTLLIAAVSSGVATFVAMTENLPGRVEPWVIVLLVFLGI